MIAKIILCFIASVLAEDFYGKYSKVEELTDANFKSKVIDSDEMWLVEFYAPWCGHCQAFKPSYEKAAKTLKGVVKVGAMNMDVEKATGSKYGVTGFPTVKFFGLDKKKEPLTYNDQRDADAVVKYVLGQISQNVKARLGGKISSDDNKKSSGSSGSKSGGSSHSDKDEVIVLTTSDFNEKVLKSKDIWIVEFYAPWCGHCKNLEPEYKAAAAKLKGQVKLGKVDATVEE